MTIDKPKRGFAAMSPEKQRAIASQGGRGVDGKFRSFSTDRELARRAGA